MISNMLTNMFISHKAIKPENKQTSILAN